MTQSQLVRRIENLERDMTDMKNKFASKARKSSRDFIGMFHNDQDFKKAMELGAEYRKSLGQKSRGGQKKK